MKKQTIALSIIGLVLVTGMASSTILINQAKDKAKASNAQTNASNIANEKTVTYKGQEGKTALELLKNTAKVETSGTGENSFITTINGIAANSKNEYWSYTINGILASVGAATYITKDSDIIKWAITSF